jgi:adenine-specific DNA glycosylase
MAGLWEFPTVPLKGACQKGVCQKVVSLKSVSPVAKEVAGTALGRKYGGEWELRASLGSVRHSVTHRDLSLFLFDARLEALGWIEEGPEAAWVETVELQGRATSSMVAKILREISGG